MWRNKHRKYFTVRVAPTGVFRGFLFLLLPHTTVILTHTGVHFYSTHWFVFMTLSLLCSGLHLWGWQKVEIQQRYCCQSSMHTRYCFPLQNKNLQHLILVWIWSVHLCETLNIYIPLFSTQSVATPQISSLAFRRSLEALKLQPIPSHGRCSWV